MLTSAWALAFSLALAAGPQSTPPPPPAAVPEAGVAATPEPSASKNEPAASKNEPDAKGTYTQPFKQVFHNLVHDMRALPSRQTALIVGAGAGGALAFRPVDDDLARWALTHPPSSYPDVGNILGDGYVQAGAAVLAYSYGYFSDQPRTTIVGSDLIRAQILNGVITTTTKVIAQRDRPMGGSRSFPSGHTSASFTSAAVLHSHLGWKVGAPAYAVAGFIGWSRLRDDEHWLTDVIMGAAIGTAVGHSVAKGHRASGWTVTPVATTKSVGIYFTK